MAELDFLTVDDAKVMVNNRVAEVQRILYPQHYGAPLGRGNVMPAVAQVDDDDEPGLVIIPGVETGLIRAKLEEMFQLLAVIDQLQGP